MANKIFDRRPTIFLTHIAAEKAHDAVEKDYVRFDGLDFPQQPGAARFRIKRGHLVGRENVAAVAEQRNVVAIAVADQLHALFEGLGGKLAIEIDHPGGSPPFPIEEVGAGGDGRTPIEREESSFLCRSPH